MAFTNLTTSACLLPHVCNLQLTFTTKGCPVQNIHFCDVMKGDRVVKAQMSEEQDL